MNTQTRRYAAELRACPTLHTTLGRLDAFIAMLAALPSEDALDVLLDVLRDGRTGLMRDIEVKIAEAPIDAAAQYADYRRETREHP